jgi:MoaA/NifB/PqqE/SkfB family radical SAM enzyme
MQVLFMIGAGERLMELSKYMEIERIEFVVTWQCGGKCEHCQVGDEINKSTSHNHILSDDATGVIKKLSTVFDISSVMTFGGEPLYYPEVVTEIHKTARLCGIKTRQIITNGYFTNNEEKSKSVAMALADGGVNSLLLSVDAFHQEYIPMEPVLRFAKDVVDAMVPGAFLHPVWLVDEEHQNTYNIKTKEILEKFSGISIPVNRGNNIHQSGHGAKLLSEYFEDVEINSDEACGSTPYSEPLDKVTSISIIPNGDVMICGFIIGNIYKEDILDIIAGYSPYEKEGMLAVINDGVPGLMAYAKSKGVEVDTSQYMTVCEACREIAKELKT